MQSRTFKLSIILLVIALCAILSFLAMLFIIKSKVKDTADKQAQAEEQNQAVNTNHSLKVLLQDIDPAAKKLSSRIVAADGTVSFIEMIENMAKARGLTVVVSSINNAEAPQKDIYQWMKITLTTEGSWQSNYQFLSLLESLPYKITIGDVTYDQTQGASEEIVVKGKTQKAASHSVWKGSYTFQVLQSK